MLAQIRTHLATIPGVTALIGADPCKVFGGDVPEYMNNSSSVPVKIAKPLVQIEWAGGDPVESFTGRTGVCETYFQVTAVAESSPVALNVYWAIYNALSQADHEFWSTMFVHRAIINLPADVSIPPTAGNESSLKMFAGRLFVRANYAP